MESELHEFDIYKFINSRDVAEHCRNIKHQFTTSEMAKIIFMSRLPDEEKMQGYEWLIKNASDSPIPDIRLHIPYFALWGGRKARESRFTKEEIRTRIKVHKGRESVLQYLKLCTQSGRFVPLADGCINLKDMSTHIPHPFKIGDELKNILTNERYVVHDVGDSVNERLGLKSRSKFCLGLYRKDDNCRLPVMMEVSDLCYCETAKPQ